MDAGGNGELVLQNRDEGVSDFAASMGNFSSPLSDKVLDVTVGSEPLYGHWDGMSSSSCAWAPLCSVEQHGEIGASSIFNHHQIDNPSYAGILQNQGTSATSPHLVQFQADHGVSGLQPHLPCFGSGRFSEMDSFFIQQRCQRFANFGFSASHSQHGSGSKTSKAWNSQSAADNFAHTRECRGLDEGSTKPSTDEKKRKRDNCSPAAQSKNLKTDQNDQHIKKLDKEKQKPEGKRPATNTSHQLVGKDVEDSSTDGDTPKEDYVHVRAKRGQATNRHSLAERVRREKIRERMKFLQDLVPGSSKIMGKAVMLDEIINYVLSLQQQVKFLSMKLATVYPEMTIDHEHILPRDGTVRDTIPGDTGMSSYPKEMLQRALLATQASILDLSTMPSMASMWNNEDDRTSRMDFNPHLAPQNPDSSGCIEVEL